MEIWSCKEFKEFKEFREFRTNVCREVVFLHGYVLNSLNSLSPCLHYKTPCLLVS